MTVNDYVRGPSPLAAAQAVELALTEGALRTLFQPIVDLRTDEVVGYEALTRGPAATGVESPDALFAAARSCRRLAELDWACRCQDRKSTRLNSSHANISYAVFCLKKKKKHC